MSLELDKKLTTLTDATRLLKRVNGFDCDGVITLGIYPGPNDVIITGRSFEEAPETLKYLSDRGITAQVYFSPYKFSEKTRERSARHKTDTIERLLAEGTLVVTFFEDDPVQHYVIAHRIYEGKLSTQLVRVNHGGLISYENQLHPVEP